MEHRRITCAECGTEITNGETTATPLEDRKPCPTCKSFNRAVEVTGAAAVGLAVTATITAGGVQTAQASGAAHDATVQTSSAPEQDALTLLGLPTRSYKIRIASLQDESCIVEVFDQDGALQVSGIGDTQVDALLEVIVYRLPRDHPEHPDSAGT